MHPLRTHLRDGLELEAARRHVAPVACLARTHVGLDDSPPRLRRAAPQLEIHLKARGLQGGRLWLQRGGLGRTGAGRLQREADLRRAELEQLDHGRGAPFEQLALVALERVRAGEQRLPQ